VFRTGELVDLYCDSGLLTYILVLIFSKIRCGTAKKKKKHQMGEKSYKICNIQT